MSDPFLAEIRMFCGNFAPVGWATCDGQLLPISQSTALFSLLGTQYGGDGRTTFALPNLQARAPLGQGQGPGLSSYVVGQDVGEATVTLLASELPVHTHTANGRAADGTHPSPAANMWGQARVGRVNDLMYGTPATTTMSGGALATVGGGQPHNNRPPYLTVLFIIALQGIYPPRG